MTTAQRAPVLARVPAAVLLRLLHLDGATLAGASGVTAPDGSTELALYLEMPGAPDGAAEVILPAVPGAPLAWRTAFGEVTPEKAGDAPPR